MPQLPPPGFYLDPDDPSRERWWDGGAWAGWTRPAPVPDASAAAPSPPPAAGAHEAGYGAAAAQLPPQTQYGSIPTGLSVVEAQESYQRRRSRALFRAFFLSISGAAIAVFLLAGPAEGLSTWGSFLAFFWLLVAPSWNLLSLYSAPPCPVDVKVSSGELLMYPFGFSWNPNRPEAVRLNLIDLHRAGNILSFESDGYRLSVSILKSPGPGARSAGSALDRKANAALLGPAKGRVKLGRDLPAGFQARPWSGTSRRHVFRWVVSPSGMEPFAADSATVAEILNDAMRATRR